MNARISEEVIETPKETLKRTVHYFYDIQKTRIGFGNRALDPADYKIAVDKKTGKEKKVKKSVAKKAMDQALLDMAEALSGSKKLAEAEDKRDVIDAPLTLEEEDRQFLKRQSLILHGLEAATLRRIEALLCGNPVYEGFLRDIKGCGPTMSGVILAELTMCRTVLPEVVAVGTRTELPSVGDFKYFRLDYEEKKKNKDGEEVTEHRQLTCFERDGQVWQDCCPTVSSLWSYAGMAVDSATGKAVRRKKGVKSNWNSFLKTKMLGVLASCFIKAKPDKYRELYDNYKHRKTSEGWGSSDAHRHNAASRYMMKMFLLDLWKFWRGLEGLPCPDSYAEAVLGRRHGDHKGTNV